MKWHKILIGALAHGARKGWGPLVFTALLNFFKFAMQMFWKLTIPEVIFTMCSLFCLFRFTQVRGHFDIGIANIILPCKLKFWYWNLGFSEKQFQTWILPTPHFPMVYWVRRMGIVKNYSLNHLTHPTMWINGIYIYI